MVSPVTEIFKSGKWNIYVERYIFSSELETVIMVNGALSTTASFTGTVRSLEGQMNIILFDLPFIGNSAQYNEAGQIISKENEVDILIDLINYYRPEHLLSVSWGGLAALMALSRQPKSIKDAAIASFSTRINEPMRKYVVKAKEYLEDRDFKKAATLLNDEVGKYLPRLMKRINYQHVSSLSQDTFQQVHFHINQIMRLDQQDYMSLFHKINVPTMFVNGELDEYTTLTDISAMDGHIRDCRFAMVPQAGHFLDLENKQAATHVKELLLDFYLTSRHTVNVISAVG